MTDLLSRYRARNKSHHLDLDLTSYMEGMSPLTEALDREASQDKNVIYIHVPFCHKICSFCSMRRSLSKIHPDYKEALLDHIRFIGQTKYGRSTTIDSVYFGGGTPTTMDQEDLAEVLEALSKHFKLQKNAEISMETTLTELDPGKLKALAGHGLNRISVGVQTFNDRGRALFNRKGSGDFAYRRVSDYLKTGFSNVNLDLIYSYPGQTLEDLEEDLRKFGDLDIGGFSFYSLILMESAKLGREAGGPEASSQDAILRDFDFYTRLVEEAETRGFEFLELTKMVRPGRDDYRYIVRNHQGRDIIPLGAGAGGSIGGTLLMNPIGLEDYFAKVKNPNLFMGMDFSQAYFDIQKATALVQFGKIDPRMLAQPERKRVLDFCQDLEADGLAKKEGDIFYLTHLGRYWGNNISEDYKSLLL